MAITKIYNTCLILTIHTNAMRDSPDLDQVRSRLPRGIRSFDKERRLSRWIATWRGSDGALLERLVSGRRFGGD